MELHFINENEQHFNKIEPGDVFVKDHAIFAMKMKPVNWAKLATKKQGLAVDLQTGELLIIPNEYWVKSLPETGLDIQ